MIWWSWTEVYSRWTETSFREFSLPFSAFAVIHELLLAAIVFQFVVLILVLVYLLLRVGEFLPLFGGNRGDSGYGHASAALLNFVLSFLQIKDKWVWRGFWHSRYLCFLFLYLLLFWRFHHVHRRAALRHQRILLLHPYFGGLCLDDGRMRAPIGCIFGVEHAVEDVGFVGFDLLVDVEHCGGNDIEDLDFLNSVRSTKGSSGSISCYKKLYP